MLCFIIIGLVQCQYQMKAEFTLVRAIYSILSNQYYLLYSFPVALRWPQADNVSMEWIYTMSRLAEGSMLSCCFLELWVNTSRVEKDPAVWQLHLSVTHIYLFLTSFYNIILFETHSVTVWWQPPSELIWALLPQEARRLILDLRWSLWVRNASLWWAVNPVAMDTLVLQRETSPHTSLRGMRRMQWIWWRSSPSCPAKDDD